MARNEIEKGIFREATVEEALPRVAKMLVKAQEEMRDKKQELELCVLSQVDGEWRSKVLDRQATDVLCEQAIEENRNEDAEMN